MCRSRSFLEQGSEDSEFAKGEEAAKARVARIVNCHLFAIGYPIVEGFRFRRGFMKSTASDDVHFMAH